MKVIIAGSRDITDYKLVCQAVECSEFNISEVVSGSSRGIDRMGELWAETRGIPVAKFKAHWDLYGKAAGPRRNTQMAKYADALIAVWDGQSSGTADMIHKAIEEGLKVYVHRV